MKKHSADANTIDDLHDSDNLYERAEWFAKAFADYSYEKGEAQEFIRGLCHVFNIRSYKRSLISFEYRLAQTKRTSTNFIDGFFPGLLLVEMKSVGRDLDKAFTQAYDYSELINDEDSKPQYILVSDFQNFRLFDRGTPSAPASAFKLTAEFKLHDFRLNVDKLGFLNNFEREVARKQEAANTAAAEALGNLHDKIKATGYDGKDLEKLLVRILFCLFADDTGLFGEDGLFNQAIASPSTREDGHDLSGMLNILFTTLDTEKNRPKKLYSQFVKFPYVNGELFKGRIADCFFDGEARAALIACNNIDWAQISPDIFGSLFQAIMHHEGEVSGKREKGDPNKRREFGAHYTSESNIRKVIDSLFLNELNAELRKIRKDADKLHKFLSKLRGLNFFDPACGCGNFLVVSYRELRLLESQTIQYIQGLEKQSSLDMLMPVCNVDQFHGIEIDESAVQIARVALWLTDHQMNMLVKNTADGKPYVRLPLKHRANIVLGNALRLDWREVIAPEKCSYVIGNPPFVGYSYQSKEQKIDLDLVFNKMDGSGVLDYVAAWYLTAARYIQNTKIAVAFVSTNSITQGEQVAVLWKPMRDLGIHLNFAHRTFRWSNEGRGIAAVHCVIIGFSLTDKKKKILFEYADIASKPIANKAKKINPYLVDAPTVFLGKRRAPICDVPEMVYGSKPTDGGNLLLDDADKAELLRVEPLAEKWIHPFLGADEFINAIPRWCLWLKDITPTELNSMPFVKKRVAAVKAMRLASPKIPTQKLAEIPHLFGELRQTDQPYLLIPSVSSENRLFIPIGYLQPNVVTSNANFMLPNATFYQFGILNSTMHNAWMRATCGRLESRYRYSNTIVYNNFPWPTATKAQQAVITKKAKAILDARAEHECKSLAWMYNPETMPENLKQAHDELDKTVEAAYGYQGADEEASRVAFLFEQHEELVSVSTKGD